MTNKDLLKAIGDIDDKYLVEKNEIEETNRIVSNKMVSIMKSLKLKYILAPVCILMIAIISYAGFIGLNRSIAPAEIRTDIRINKIKNLTAASLDADVKIIEIDDLQKELDFIKNIKIPGNMKLDSSYTIYTRENFQNSGDYNVLHDYVLSYRESHLRNIKIRFSTLGAPLRDCYIESEEKISKLQGVDLIIGQYKDTYIVTFNYKGMYFNIETNNVTEDELIELLKSIIIDIC